jgi:hypothetical protein
VKSFVQFLQGLAPAFVLLLASRGAFGGSFGSSGALLMAEGLAVRPLGAAFAFSALADDESSLHINPAGLARLDGLALSGGHVLGLLESQISYLDLAYSQRDIGAVGMQAAYFGDTDTLRDAQGNDLGSFDNRQMLFGLGLAKELSPGWRFGLEAKGLREEYAGIGTNSFAGDAGLQGPLPYGWRFGLEVQNAGQQAALDSSQTGFPTPLRIQGGVALPFFVPSWKVEADVQGLPNDEEARLLLGTELRADLPSSDADRKNGVLPPRLSLRGGSQVPLLKSEDSRLYLGAGVELPPNYALDYALVNLGPLGLTHRFSLGMHFQGKPDQGPSGATLSAPYGVFVTEQLDGLLITWSDSNERVAGYNLYSDYGVLAERLTNKPVKEKSQKFVKVTKSRTYSFYVRAVGSDGKEGPPSEVLVWTVK